MHGYSLYYRDIYNSNRVQTGIDKKVASQIAAFNRAELNCEFVFCPQPETTLSMVRSCLPLFPDGIRWPQPEELRDANYIYIRRPRFASRELIRFLKGFRRLNPSALIIYEIPTYPYDGEMKTPRLFLALKKDKRWRTHLKECVDFVGDLSGHDALFSMPAVHFTNGVDMASISPRTPVPLDDSVHIMFVAYFEPWHGADRLLCGLRRYYDEEPSPRAVTVHMCGAGSQLPTLKRLASSLEISKYVKFYGALSSDELAPVYDACSIGVESLGRHRSGENMVSASLKSREYLAKGLPFICSNEVDCFVYDPVDFCLQIPADESPVSISDVLAFHDRLYAQESPEDLVQRIRAYAERHVSIDAAMSNVIALIKDHCG